MTTDETIDWRSGYDPSQPYHARLKKVAAAAIEVGFRNPCYYLEVAYPKVGFSPIGDILVAFGHTDYDDDPPAGKGWYFAQFWSDTTSIPWDDIEARTADRIAIMARDRAHYLTRTYAPVCECGHMIAEHQTGEGPWTGFCYGDADECKCESPSVS